MLGQLISLPPTFMEWTHVWSAPPISNFTKFHEISSNFAKFREISPIFKFHQISPNFKGDLACVHSMKVGPRLRSWPNMCSLHEGWIKTEELTYHVFTPWRLDQDWGLVVEVVVFIVVVHFHQILPTFTNFHQINQNLGRMCVAMSPKEQNK